MRKSRNDLYALSEAEKKQRQLDRDINKVTALLTVFIVAVFAMLFAGNVSGAISLSVILAVVLYGDKEKSKLQERLKLMQRAYDKLCVQEAESELNS